MSYYQFGDVRVADFMVDNASMEELEDLSTMLKESHGVDVPVDYIDFQRKLYGSQ
jgi:hypothetical protein